MNYKRLVGFLSVFSVWCGHPWGIFVFRVSNETW